MAAEKTRLQGFAGPVGMGIVRGATKDCFIQQGALGVADQLEAVFAHAGVFEALLNLLDLLLAAGP